MIMLRHFLILGLLAAADRLIRANERALGVGSLNDPLRKIEHAPVTDNSFSEPGAAGNILLASLVGIAIAATWIWFTARAMG